MSWLGLETKKELKNRPYPTSKRSLDFIIAGAEKAGTSYLSKALSLSNDIYMPEKEVRFFRDPFYSQVNKLDDLFIGREDLKVGIKHPSYLGRTEAPARIFEHNKNIKLIFILRDPVERAISSYLHYIRHGQIPLLHPNSGLLTMIEEAENYPKYKDIIEFGLYFKYIEKYLEFFPRENMLFLEYEHFLTGQVDMMPVTQFLGISPIYNPPVSIINEGSKNWYLCVLDFIKSLGTYRYDLDMNIVGKHNHPYLESFNKYLPELKSILADDTIIIEPIARERLRLYYEKDVAALKHSGVLVPVNW